MEVPLSRRTVCLGVSCALTLPLAGCSWEGDPVVVDERQFTLTVVLENEDGESVSSGVVVLVTAEAESLTTEYHALDIEDGEIHHDGVGGAYHLEVTPEEDAESAFDPVEKTFSLEDDERVTLVLEGGEIEDGRENESDETANLKESVIHL